MEHVATRVGKGASNNVGIWTGIISPFYIAEGVHGKYRTLLLLGMCQGCFLKQGALPKLRTS